MRITEQNFVEKAENAIKELKEQKNKAGKNLPRVTTSQIRNLLALSADIYNEVIGYRKEELSAEIRGRIQYLKVRMVYESGRTDTVKRFVISSELLEVLDEIKGKKQNYLLFHKYMEALVAYHKFYNGKD